MCCHQHQQHQGETTESTHRKNCPLASVFENLKKKEESRCCHYCTTKADKYCEVCDVFLCNTCFPIEHPPTRVLNSHSIIAPSKAAPKCPDHPLESLRFYCQNCLVVVCRDCVVMEHSGHTLFTSEEAAVQKRNDFAAISRVPVRITIQTSEQNLKRSHVHLMDLKNQIKKTESEIQREEELVKKLMELDRALDMTINQPSDTDLLSQSQAVLEDLKRMCSVHKVQIAASFSSVGSWSGPKIGYRIDQPRRPSAATNSFAQSQRYKFHVNGYNK